MNILSFFGHFIWKFTNFIAGSESRTSKLSNDVSFVIFVHQTWYLEGWVKLTPPHHRVSWFLSTPEGIGLKRVRIMHYACVKL